MKILVINAGSSSLKYQLIDMDNTETLTVGLVEKIGGNSEFHFTNKGQDKKSLSPHIENHTKALKIVIDTLLDKENGCITDLSEINAVGHRIVHGGEKLISSVLIDQNVKAEIKKAIALAPLHNPAGLQGIEACEALLDVPNVAVFDTSFHGTMDEVSYIYPLPYEYYEKYQVRRYGMHGTSHKYVAQKAANYLQKPLKECNLISCHLGNGASLCAIRNGKSVDTSMGMTPLEGVMMGTRCGDIDPSIVPFLMEKENLSPHEIDDIMNKKSGLLGLSGISNDAREVASAAENGNKRAILARKKQVHTIRHYLGAYLLELGHVDAIIFTAGMGENDTKLREMVLENLENFGIIIDLKQNEKRLEINDFTAKEGKIKTLSIATNEELMIAMDTKDIVTNGK